MIITMTQDHTPAEHAQSHIEYSFFLKNNKISSFVAPRPPALNLLGANLDQSLENSFVADYKGQKTIHIQTGKNNECPPGYVEKTLVYFTKENDGSKKSISKYYYNYYDAISNQKIGFLYYVTKVPPKKKFFDFFRAYQYESLNYGGNIYDLYYVVIAKQGIFYCVYMNDQLVAMVHKRSQVVDYKDSYTIYSLNGIDVDALCLIAAHFDYTRYEQFMPQSQKSGVNYAPVNTEFRKEVIEKYDPTFITKVIELEKPTVSS